MNAEERVYGALQLKPIDRVPTFEWLLAENVRNALAPGCNYNEFIEKMDIDAAVVELDLIDEWLDANSFRDAWGVIKRKTIEEYPVPIRGPLSDAEDLRHFTPPDYRNPKYYRSLEEALAFHRGKRAVVLRLNDVWSIPCRLFENTEEFLCATLLEPDFVAEVIEMVVDTYLGFAREAVKRGCRICFTGDDYADNKGPLVSPATFRQLFLPPLKRVMSGFRDNGLLVIKHTDGNIRSLLDMIMEVPFDCLDPIDPQGGMNLAEMKQKYGHSVCLKGNVSCSGVLTFGTVEETIAETKRCLADGMGIGGYICSSSNSILSSVRPENYRAMLDTIRNFGVY